MIFVINLQFENSMNSGHVNARIVDITIVIINSIIQICDEKSLRENVYNPSRILVRE